MIYAIFNLRALSEERNHGDYNNYRHKLTHTVTCDTNRT
jgi:hypothetical protein